jgi:hypothetical protein
VRSTTTTPASGKGHWSVITSAEYWKTDGVEQDRIALGKPVTALCKTLNMEAKDQLREVQRNGAVAQAERAGELLTQIMANPNDPQLEVEAYVLYDAYLNDPYLTRNKQS